MAYWILRRGIDRECAFSTSADLRKDERTWGTTGIGCFAKLTPQRVRNISPRAPPPLRPAR